MLKTEQVPDEVVEAFVDAFHGKDMTRKAAIAAALSAWPGMDSIMLPRMVRPGHFVPQNYIRLPIAPPASRRDE